MKHMNAVSLTSARSIVLPQVSWFVWMTALLFVGMT